MAQKDVEKRPYCGGEESKASTITPDTVANPSRAPQTALIITKYTHTHTPVINK